MQKSTDTLHISVVVKNTGEYDGDEVAQLYIRYPELDRMPLKELKGFRRVTVAAGGSQRIEWAVPLSELKKWDLQKKQWKLYPGAYEILVGASSADIRLQHTLQISSRIK